MNKLEEISSGLARRIGRRTVLDRTAKALFVGGMSVAVRGIGAKSVYAHGCNF
jgi:hypothetical protein